MRISIIVEGETETVLHPHLIAFLKDKLGTTMPVIQFRTPKGRIPKGNSLKRLVEQLLTFGHAPSDYVIALTDVYTGTSPPDFIDANDAKDKMTHWVGKNARFFPHAAQYEFEAWLIPFWEDIRKLAGHNRAAPGPQPEKVNHGNPPSARIKEVFRLGSCGRHYRKQRDAARILRDKRPSDLVLAANQCPELKSFLNTILRLCGGDELA